MTASLSDLIPIPTKDEVLTKFVGLLRLAGFPTASWQTTSFMRHTVEEESTLLADVVTTLQKLGKAGFIKLAAEVDDDWVDLGAENFFNETRKPAVFTQGSAKLTDAAASGPHTINVGTFWIANADKSLRYYNTTGGTLNLGSTLTLTFAAETAGTDWNVGNDALTEILTPLPGVTVTNPAQDTGTWITQQGADEESSAALALRCLDKWSLAGAGCDDAAYRYRGLSAASEITRCYPYSPGAGAVRVIVAGDAGPVSSTALAAADTIIQLKRPLGVPDVQVLNATPYVQSVSGVLYLTAGVNPAATLSAAQASVNAFTRALNIGSKVSREKLINALLVSGVEDLELSTPTADYQLGPTEVWLPSFALTTQ
jgi:hypothetical protein